jgi:hypothetical protein
MANATVTRRQFGRLSAAVGASAAIPRLALSAGNVSPNEKLNVAFVGAGGKGHHAIQVFGHGKLAHEVNLAAFCDVDDTYAGKSYEVFPKVPRFTDYRKMYDAMEKKIDAVVVSTPDHHHFPASMMALKRGKHVYCEKPLTYTIEQGRQMARVARAKKLATQMGNQGNSSESTRLVREWVKAGVLGEVREIFHWNDYPMAAREPRKPTDIPPGVDWDTWLGPVPSRPFTTGTIRMGWHPFSDICNGLIGNWGTHHLSAGWWALDLGAPSTIEVVRQTEWPVKESYPLGFVLKYTFPPRGSRKAVTVWFYGGTLAASMPRPKHLEPDRKLSNYGQVIVGSEASVMGDPWCSQGRMIPEKKMQEVGRVPQTVESYGEHMESWAKACKQGTRTSSDFDFASQVTEVALLGSIALLHGKTLEWDTEKMCFPKDPAANKYLRVELRKGWDV